MSSGHVNVVLMYTSAGYKKNSAIKQHYCKFWNLSESKD